MQAYVMRPGSMDGASSHGDSTPTASHKEGASVRGVHSRDHERDQAVAKGASTTQTGHPARDQGETCDLGPSTTMPASRGGSSASAAPSVVKQEKSEPKRRRKQRGKRTKKKPTSGGPVPRAPDPRASALSETAALGVLAVVGLWALYRLLFVGTSA